MLTLAPDLLAWAVQAPTSLCLSAGLWVSIKWLVRFGLHLACAHCWVCGRVGWWRWWKMVSWSLAAYFIGIICCWFLPYGCFCFVKFLTWLLFIGVLTVFTYVMLNTKRFKRTLILQLNSSHSVSVFCNAEKRVCVFDVWLVGCLSLCSPNGLLLTNFSSQLDSDVTHKIISTIRLSLFLCKITVGL